MEHNTKHIYHKHKIPIKYRLILLHSSISSILLYGIHTFNITQYNLNRLQSFYSKCTREVSEGIRFNQNIRRKTNKEIRIEHKIPTIKSKLEFMKINTYYTWKKTFSIAYLNNQDEINSTLISFHNYLLNLHNLITQNSENSTDAKIKHLQHLHCTQQISSSKYENIQNHLKQISNKNYDQMINLNENEFKNTVDTC